jgi:hypothetical protein
MGIRNGDCVGVLRTSLPILNIFSRTTSEGAVSVTITSFSSREILKEGICVYYPIGPKSIDRSKWDEEGIDNRETIQGGGITDTVVGHGSNNNDSQ